MTPRRFFISTGDPSGDWHGAEVAKQLKKLDATVQVSGVGGAQMRSAGVHLIHSPQEAMGKVGLSALWAIPAHVLLAREILAYLKRFRPDVVLLIDYGGFHLKLAKLLKKRGYCVHYYITPQVWASRPNRLNSLSRHIQHAYCIFPFEVPLLTARGVMATFVGHPLVLQLPPPASRAEICRALGLDPERPIIALLPGSRRSEVKSLLTPMLAAVAQLQKMAQAAQEPVPQAVLSQANALPDEWFEPLLALNQHWMREGQVTLLNSHQNNAISTHNLLSVADAAVIASGTATLEAALYQTPHVLGYRGSWLANFLVRRFILLPGLGLPNILNSPQLLSNWPKRAHPEHWQPIVPELLQNDFVAEKIAAAMWPLLHPNTVEYRRAMKGFQQISASLSNDNTQLSTPGGAAQRVASGLIQATTL
ncbi:MAG: hypothetical protein VKK59_05030 [Vampirovibrionales bacterium]|nr:hypothetical protein [Vampirovibrionales bacterium]